MKYEKVKRFFDIILSLILITILSPLFIIIPITLQLTNISNEIGYFKQKRTGINGKEFYIYKFRSLIIKNNTDYVTKYASILRKYGIDEIPQLINILKGDMSFIGPRPLPISYYEYYTDEQKMKLKVLPGIFNPVISNNKEDSNILEKINLEIEYVKNISLKNDLLLIKNMLINLPSIIKNRNVGSYGNSNNLNNDLMLLKENYLSQISIQNESEYNLSEDEEVIEDVNITDVSLTNSNITDELLEYYEAMLNNYVEPKISRGPKLVKQNIIKFR